MTMRQGWVAIVLAIGCHSARPASLGTVDSPAVTTTAPASSAATPRPSVICPQHLPRFEAYPADSIYHGHPAWPNVSLGPDSEALGNRSLLALAEAKDSGPDFAGYLKVVESGCGSPCQVQQLVDVRLGKVVGSVTTNLGTAHRVDSRLLVANPMDSAQCYDSA